MTPPDPLHLPPGRVLIIKPSSLGDVATAVPVLRGVKRKYPDTHVAWLVATSCADLIRHDRDLDEVILFDRELLGRAWRSPGAMRGLLRLLGDLRRGQFDLVIDLQGLLRSGLLAMATGAPVRVGFAQAREGATLFYTHTVKSTATHTVDRNMEVAAFLGIDARAHDMVLDVAPEGEAFASEFLSRQGLKGRDFVVCVPPTRWPTKVYPVRHWRKVVAALSRHAPVVVVGAPGDASLCQSIADGSNEPRLERSASDEPRPVGSGDSPSRSPDGQRVFNLAGRTNIAQMVGLIAASAGVICSDSAASFIAPAVGVDVITLVGPTQVERTGPYVPGPQVHAKSIVADTACQGCLKRRCPHITCMELIDPAEVVQAGLDMIAHACSKAPQADD